MPIRSTVIVLAGLLAFALPAAAQAPGFHGKQTRVAAALGRSGPTAGAQGTAPFLAKAETPRVRSTAGPGAGARAVTYLKDDAALRSIRLQPRAPRTPPAGAEAEVKTVARIWNGYGGMIEALSGRLAVKPEAAVAVIAAESSGQAFVDGRPVIRFENHQFWKHWGRENPQTFARHFRYRTEGGAWKDHEFRASPAEPWSSVHGHGQAREWRVFLFARELNRPAALKSASWGLTQIMGFNHGRVGYPSPEAMTTSFSDPAAGAQMQILGLFDFVLRGQADSRALGAFRDRDWFVFAEEYNGKKNAPVYAKRLRTYYEAATRLLQP